MKKILMLSSLALIISPCSFANPSSPSVKQNAYKEAGDSTSEITYLPIDVDGNFTLESSSKEAVTTVSSFIKSRTDTFWTTRSFNALDRFVDSINNNGEDWTGTFKSRTFVQNRSYIYFTLGGNASNEVSLIDETENNEVIANVKNDYFKDPEASCNMLLRYIEVSDSYLGHKMHIEVKDSTGSGFGGVTFGDLHVNQTEEDVAKATSVYLNNLAYSSTAAKDAENTKKSRDYVCSLYKNESNADLYKFYNYGLTDGNVTFDQGNDNLSTLAFDSEYAEDLGDFQFDKFISTDKAYDWNEQMPFNNDGHFFNGNGYSERNENAKFRFLTNKFTLSGTGLVSIKMAGRSAQLQVLDPSKIGTGEDPILEKLDVQDFADNGVPNVYLLGSNYNTMHRVYWDLSKYTGQDIVLSIADKDTEGNWGMIFFDDLITKYDKLPSFGVDVFTQTHKESNDTYYGAFTDLYAKASDNDGEYNAVFSEAYAFLRDYYASAAKENKKHDYFDGATVSSFNSTRDAYKKLSAEAKAVVDKSQDFYFDGEGDDWQKTAPKTSSVANRIAEKVVVTLVNGEGSAEELASTKSIYVPETPTKDSTYDMDYVFDGWYTDNTYETPYSATAPLTSDITLYAKWSTKDSADIVNIENSETKAQLAYAYEATTTGEGEEASTTYEISNVAIRFGGLIKQGYYDAIKDHVTGYGVYLTTKMPNGYASVKQAIIDEKFGDGELTTCENSVSASGHPSIASEAQKGALEDDYYIFNAYISVPEADYATTVYAAAFVKIDSGKIAYLSERSGSVASLAQEYLDIAGASYSVDVEATLNQLKAYKGE